jgi:hypothetical protein
MHTPYSQGKPLEVSTGGFAACAAAPGMTLKPSDPTNNPMSKRYAISRSVKAEGCLHRCPEQGAGRYGHGSGRAVQVCLKVRGGGT